MRADAAANDSLLGRLQRHAEQRPEAIAYRMIASADGITYGRLQAAVRVLSHRLIQRHRAGEVIVLSCANRVEYPIAFLAILAAGCSVFAVSSEAAGAELQQAAREAEAAGIIGDGRTVGILRDIVRDAIEIGSIMPVGEAPSPPAGMREPRAGTGFLLLQSSGTTGLPKIVRRSSQSLAAEASAVVDSVGFAPDDRVLMTVPLTHSYGLEHGLLAPIWAGSSVCLADGLDLHRVLAEVNAGGVTLFPGVPSTFEMLSRSAGQGSAPSTLRRAYAAGAPLPVSVCDAFAQRHGVQVTQLYGATEIGSVTYNPPDDPYDAASVGYPMHDVSVHILDASALLCSPGTQGEIAVRAASMFDGYLGAPAGLIDGHFPTGDLGYLDERGRLFVTGRTKLLIDVGGLKVNPLEVEAVLGAHPAVGSCVVVPVRQSQTVFRLKAIVTPSRPSASVPIEELRSLARARLASYKVPRLFEVRESVPRSATGKIVRHLLES